MPIIVGLSAKKQGGKSTLVDFLKGRIPCCEVIRFADALKQIVLDCFIPRGWNWTHVDYLDLEENKNKVLPCGKTVRKMLQVIGTDWFRHAWEDCWVEAYLKKVWKANAAYILTPDVRFQNELRIIQKMGGKVIRLLRAPYGEEDQHESETALDEIEKNTILLMQEERNTTELEETEIIEPTFPGQCFDIIYDNRNKTLADAEVWAESLVKKCFIWGGNSEGITNPELDLSKYYE